MAVEQVVPGNGADELIRLCAVATLDGGDRAAFPWPLFNVNQPAQEAAVASLADSEVVAGRVDHARRARDFLFQALAFVGLAPVESQANFVYADVPGGDAAGLADRLLREEGFIVRDLGGFGAPEAIRVTCGTDEENEAFAAALARVTAV